MFANEREEIMRKIIVLAAAVVLSYAGIALAGPMANTAHDMSSGSTADVKSSGAGSTDQLCIFCHTPHNGSPAAGRPLWNHALTTQALTWTPTTTVRGTTLPTDITSAALNGSRACMSCHDGTVAVGQVLYTFTAPTGTTFPMTSTAGVLTAGKLDADSTALFSPTTMETNHPVGVQEPAAVTGYTTFIAPTDAVDYDANGYVQCGSCHNPHLTGTVANPAPFLKKSNAGSAICISCHNL